jgi:hypothetical protein
MANWMALPRSWCSRLSPGSVYRKENKAVDRISESSKASLLQTNISIVSISLKSDDFSPFGASACTKNEEEPFNSAVNMYGSFIHYFTPVVPKTLSR